MCNDAATCVCGQWDEVVSSFILKSACRVGDTDDGVAADHDVSAPWPLAKLQAYMSYIKVRRSHRTAPVPRHVSYSISDCDC